MPKHVKRIECCYCGAASLVNLNNPNEMHLICSGCGARMDIDRLAPLSSTTPQKREVVFVPGPKSPPSEPRRSERKERSRRDDDYERRKPRKRRRSFLKRLEDVWDEIEDIFD